MYFAIVILCLFVGPALSLAADATLSHHGLTLALVAKWYVFWAVGVRLLLAGIRQVAQPRFTVEKIFDIHDARALPIVREIGFGNLSMGILAVLSLLRREWVIPAAIVGGLYYGLAGLGHLPNKNKNAKEYTAMLTDLFAALVLLICAARITTW